MMHKNKNIIYTSSILKTFALQKALLRGLVTKWEKIFANYISNKELVKRTIKLNTEKMIQLENEQKDRNTQFTEEEIQRANKYMNRCFTS